MQSFLLFWTILCTFIPLKTRKIWKNEKNSWRYFYFTNVYNKWQSYVWSLKYGSNKHSFFVILGHFFPFYPINNLKNQNLEKKKKTPLGDIIILHLCITNDNHMIYVSWDMECGWQTELIVNLGHFLPAYPSKNHKNENFQKLKKKQKKKKQKKTKKKKRIYIIL